jgi:hypothetical protein
MTKLLVALGAFALAAVALVAVAQRPGPSFNSQPATSAATMSRDDECGPHDGNPIHGHP